MAHNSLYPGYIKLTHTNNLIQHSMTIPVNPVGGWTVGIAPEVINRAGGTIGAALATTGLMTVLRPLFAPTTLFDAAEFWFYENTESDPVWVWTEPIGLAGTSASAVMPMGQAVMSFRTVHGGIYKAYLMEPSLIFTINSRQAWPAFPAAAATFANYVIGNGSIVVGRDNGQIVIPMWNSVKTSDAIRKKRLLM